MKKVKNIHTKEAVPQLHFNQLNAMANHIHAIGTEQDIHWDLIEDTAHYATINRIIPVKLTRKIVQQRPDWEQ